MKNLNTYVLETKKISSIDDYVLEGLRINQSTKKNISQHNYFPKNKKELQKILKERLKEDPNANLNDIDISEITDLSDLFNQKDIDPHNIDISAWDVSNVEDMGAMFLRCYYFNCDLSEWDVSKVKNMRGMFYGCENFEGKGLENWDISNVEDISWMFDYCKNFNCDLSNWDTRNVKSLECTFGYCDNFNCDLSKWNTAKVTDMTATFYMCKKFNCDLSKWNVDKVGVNMEDTFDRCDLLIENNKVPDWWIYKYYKYEKT